MQSNYPYYVYQLIDSRDNKVFYVGKGKKNRIDCHEKEAIKGVQSYKCNKIRSIWDDGHKVIKQKVAYFNDEKFAYIHEADLIAEHGIENLTNVTLACSIVTNKKAIVNKSERAFTIIKALKTHFASWLKLTKAGKYKIAVESNVSFNAIAMELFYNEFALKAFNTAIAKEKTANKIIKLMQEFKINLVIERELSHVS